MNSKPPSTTSQKKLGWLNTHIIKIIIVISLLASVLYLFLGAEDSLLDVRTARQQLAQAEVEVDRLKTQNDSLQQALWRLENDPAYLEKVAREEYGLIKPGERVYRLSSSTDSLSIPTNNLPTLPNKTTKTPAD